MRFREDHTLRLEAVDEYERLVYVVKHHTGRTAPRFKLYGYDRERNELNLLERFEVKEGLDRKPRASCQDVEETARGLIRQYAGDHHEIRRTGRS